MIKKVEYKLPKKPKPFIAPGSQTPITAQEIERRKRQIERLEMIGETPTRVTDEEFENPYKLKAIELIAEDKDVPEDILREIQEFEKKYKSKN